MIQNGQPLDLRQVLFALFLDRAVKVEGQFSAAQAQVWGNLSQHRRERLEIEFVEAESKIEIQRLQ